jgi:DNA-binding response OmpR family regulator
LTGYGTPEDRETALAAGFDAFLVKPFDLHAFEAAVASAERSRREDMSVGSSNSLEGGSFRP